MSFGCSLCIDQFLIKYYGFKMQGKRDIASDITGKVDCRSFFTKRPWLENHAGRKYVTFSLAL